MKDSYCDGCKCCFAMRNHLINFGSISNLSRRRAFSAAERTFRGKPILEEQWSGSDPFVRREWNHCRHSDSRAKDHLAQSPTANFGPSTSRRWRKLGPHCLLCRSRYDQTYKRLYWTGSGTNRKTFRQALHTLTFCIPHLTEHRKWFSAIICNGGRTAAQLDSEGTGTGLSIQNGTDPLNDLITVSHDEHSTQTTTQWTLGHCFYTMGQKHSSSTLQLKACL